MPARTILVRISKSTITWVEVGSDVQHHSSKEKVIQTKTDSKLNTHIILLNDPPNMIQLFLSISSINLPIPKIIQIQHFPLGSHHLSTVQHC